MKTFIKLILLVIFICGFIYTAITLYKNLPHVYTEAYPTLYQDQLRIMFGPDYQIGEKKTIHIKAENCDCGFHTDGYIYDEWDITYQDQNGYTYTQTLNNRTNLASQQLSWMQNQLSAYYKQKYLLNRFPEGTFQDLSADEYFGKSYCFISIGYPVTSYTSDLRDEYEQTKEKGMKYKEALLQNLMEDENLISFYKLDYENIFNFFPMCVSIDLSIDDPHLQGKEKELHESKLRSDILGIMEEINRDTNYTGNLTMYISSDNGGCNLYDGSRSWRYYILLGKPFEEKDSENMRQSYDWQLYYAYEGIYW